MIALTNAELDRKIAIDIMKWHEHKFDDWWGMVRWENEEGETMCLTDYWKPSEKLDQAWQVVENRKADGWYPIIQCDTESNGTRVSFYRRVNQQITEAVIDDSFARAICLAALQTVEGK